MALSTGLGLHTGLVLTCQARPGMFDTDVLDAKRSAGGHGHSQPGAQDLAATLAVLQLGKPHGLCGGSLQLAQASRMKRTVVNDTKRLRKCLARFELDWEGAAASAR